MVLSARRINLSPPAVATYGTGTGRASTRSLVPRTSCGVCETCCPLYPWPFWWCLLTGRQTGSVCRPLGPGPHCCTVRATVAASQCKLSSATHRHAFKNTRRHTHSQFHTHTRLRAVSMRSVVVVHSPVHACTRADVADPPPPLGPAPTLLHTHTPRLSHVPLSDRRDPTTRVCTQTTTASPSPATA